MTAGTEPRKTGVVLLAAMAAAAFWAGWGIGLLPVGMMTSALGAGLIAAVALLLIGGAGRDFGGLAGTLLALCPTAALLITLGQAESLAEVAARVGLWPLVLSLFAAQLAVSLLPDMATRAVLARGAVVLSLALTLALPLGAAALADRWVLQSPVHLLIVYTACLVFAAQASAAFIGPPDVEEKRMIAGMTQLLPLLGFAGTVWGIMVALGALPAVFASETPGNDALQELLGGLGTAFETTLLGLAAAVIAAVVDLLLPDDAGPPR